MTSRQFFENIAVKDICRVMNKARCFDRQCTQYFSGYKILQDSNAC